eukprot:Hpha_TRINITY_DN35178_c0_g1::TRINITY_DN35178_c0_g1_i1::g.168360::m.168360
MGAEDVRVWVRLEEGEEGSEQPMIIDGMASVAELLQKSADYFEFREGIRPGSLRLMGVDGPTHNRVLVRDLDGAATYLIRVPPPEAAAGGGSSALYVPTIQSLEQVSAKRGGGGDEELQQFANYNGLDEDTICTLQRCKPETVQSILEGGNPVDTNCRNASAVVMSKVRKLEPEVGLLVARSGGKKGKGSWGGGWDDGGKGGALTTWGSGKGGWDDGKGGWGDSKGGR